MSGLLLFLTLYWDTARVSQETGKAAQRGPVYCAQFPPVVVAHLTIVQYQKQKIYIGTPCSASFNLCTFFEGCFMAKDMVFWFMFCGCLKGICILLLLVEVLYKC